MRNRWSHVKGCWAPCLMAVALLVDASLMSAQVPGARRVNPPRVNPQRLNKGKANGNAKGKQAIIGEKRLQQNPAAGAAVERFLQMKPEDRRKALAKLPPDRQRLLLQRIGLVESLSDEERKQLRGRQQALLDLPEGRQQVVREELKNLRQMSKRERVNRLGGEEIRQNFSPEEQRLLNDVAGPGAQE